MATFTNTWDTTYRNSPLGVDDPRQVDDRIRDFKLAVEERATRELFWTAGTDTAKHGGFRMGAGRAYVGNYSGAYPTTKPNGEALDSDDKGRLAFDSATAYLPRVRTSAAWVGFLKELARVSLQGSLGVLTNCVPPIVFPRACSITKVTARLGVVASGASVIVDLNKNGAAANSIFAGKTRITITAGSYANSVTSFHATYSVLAADDYLTLDIDNVGSSSTGSNLGVTIEVSF